MDPNHRIVSRLPLKALQSAGGEIELQRGPDLKEDDIRDLLRQGRVQFIVADCGEPLNHIDIADCYDFWKREVRQHIADPEGRTYLENFPNCYCYFASLWSHPSGAQAVLLEKSH